MQKKLKLSTGIKVLFLIFSLLIITNIACRDSSQPSKVRIGYLPYSSALSFFVAYENGYFSDLDVEIEPVKVATSNEAMDALRANRLDFVMGVGLSTFFAIEAAAPDLFKFFQPCVEDSAHNVSYLLTPKQSTLRNVNQLIGKRVGTYSGTSQILVLRLLLQNLGLDPDRDVQLGDVSSQFQVDALAAGRFDAFLMLEPYATRAMVMHDAQPLVAGPRIKYILNPFPAGANAVSTKFLANHPEITQNIVGAIDRAIYFINNNEEEAKNMLPKYDPSLTVELAVKTGIYKWWQTEETDITAIQRYADLLYVGGVLRSPVSVNSMILE